MKRTKPESMVVFGLAAIGLIGYLLADFVIKYIRGAENAPGLYQLIVVAVVMVAAILLVALLTWRCWRRIKQRNDYFKDED